MYTGLAIQGKDDYKFTKGQRAPHLDSWIKPKWKHKSIYEITQKEIDWYFTRTHDTALNYYEDYPRVSELDRITFNEFTDFWFDDKTMGLFWDRDLRANQWPVHWFAHNEEIDDKIKKNFLKYFEDLGKGKFNFWK